MSNLKIKVCGMREPENIQDLALLDIDFMGFIFYAPSKRFTAELPTAAIPSRIKKTGVFVNATQAYIQAKIDDGLQAIQLHGDEPAALCASLKKDNDIPLIKAFGVDESMDWSKLNPYEGHVDYFLFDTKSAAYGGLGKAFDWEVLKGYALPTPYFLSGGLSLENLDTALHIEDPRLIGLDLNSQFEDQPALKNIDNIKQALKIIKA